VSDSVRKRWRAICTANAAGSAAKWGQKGRFAPERSQGCAAAVLPCVMATHECDVGSSHVESSTRDVRVGYMPMSYANVDIV
jgi:hypothetical protein